MITPEKRYQVFISSTYEDLKEERNEVTKALLELDCIPCGMEAFPAADDTQWRWIQRMIDGCDYYIVIVAGKAGTINPDTDISYTRMEYEYAIKKGVPVLGFVVENEDKLLKKQIETDPVKIQKLKDFKDLVKSRMCKFYTNTEDLGAKVSRSLVQAIKQYPREGWVRAGSLENYTSNEKVIKLMEENKALRASLKPKDDLLRGEDAISLNIEITDKYDIWDTTIHSLGLNYDVVLSINEIFFLFGKYLLLPTTNQQESSILKSELKRYVYKKIAHKIKLPSNIKLDDIEIDLNWDDFNRILFHLEALNLIRQVPYNSWELTKNGRKIYVKEKAFKKED